MKKINIIMMLLISGALFLFASDEILKQADMLDAEGKYTEALKALTDKHDPKNPDAQICWRISRETYEVSELTSVKEEKIKLFEQGEAASKPFLDIELADKRTKAEIIHWYAINYASRMKLLGIFGGRESMSVVPNMFKLIDKCIQIDPSYPGAYFFKAKLLEEVPFFLGGDKFEMSKTYQLALKNADEKQAMFFYYNAALAYLRRDWSIDKKRSTAADKKSSDGTPENIDDKEYALQLLVKAKEMYESKSEKSDREKKIYPDIIKILGKNKK